MTVRELLAELQHLPRDLEVLAFEAGCEFSRGRRGNCQVVDDIAGGNCQVVDDIAGGNCQVVDDIAGG